MLTIQLIVHLCFSTKMEVIIYHLYTTYFPILIQ